MSQYKGGIRLSRARSVQEPTSSIARRSIARILYSEGFKGAAVRKKSFSRGKAYSIQGTYVTNQEATFWSGLKSTSYFMTMKELYSVVS
jgi:hypothetical protein